MYRHLMQYLGTCLDLENQKSALQGLIEQNRRRIRALNDPPMPKAPVRAQIATPDYQKEEPEEREVTHLFSSVLFFAAAFSFVMIFVIGWEYNASIPPFIFAVVLAIAGGITRGSESNRMEEQRKRTGQRNAVRWQNDFKRTEHERACSEENEKYNAARKEFEQAVLQRNKIIHANRLKREYLNKEIARFEVEIKKIDALLAPYYSEGIVHPKHRNPHCLSLIYDYFDTRAIYYAPRGVNDSDMKDSIDHLDHIRQFDRVVSALDGIGSTLNNISRTAARIYQQTRRLNQHMSDILAQSRIIAGRLEAIAEKNAEIQGALQNGFNGLNSSMSAINSSLSGIQQSVVENTAATRYYGEAARQHLAYRNWITHNSGYFKNAGFFRNTLPPTI